MPTEAELLQGIAENPGELDRWLILSDWLEDQADPRAELARLRYLLHTEPEHLQIYQRLARQLALLDSGLSPVAPTRSDNALNMPFALILPGTFLIGSPLIEHGRYDDETLQRVTLPDPYFLGVYPVTVGEFRTFAQAAGYQTRAEKHRESQTWRTPGFRQNNRHPVVCLSWHDVKALTEWLNSNTGTSGLVYDLPSEAQWEYACRAGTQTAYWWGDSPRLLEDRAWFADNANNKTHSVATKRPNPWGLWHMHGHVWEWCRDVYAARSSARIMRGGCWFSEPRFCRAALRTQCDPNNHYTGNGFRLAAFGPGR